MPTDEQIVKAWPALTPQERLIVMVTYWADAPWSIREIAAGLRQSKDGVFRSMQRIKAKLGGE